MRPGYILTMIIIIAVIAVVMVLHIAGSAPPGTVAPQSASTDVQDEQVQLMAVQVEDGAPISGTTQPEAAQVTPLQDGPSLVADHCAQCHAPQWLEQFDKPRLEWEITLAQMESMGVQLDESQKDILLDYLSRVGE